MVRRGRNNRLLVRPILEMVFDDGPKQHDLSYGLPGQSLLENKNYSSRRIYGVGQNFYQKEFYNTIVKQARIEGEGHKFSSMHESECQEESLLKYFGDGRATKRKKHTAFDLILED